MATATCESCVQQIGETAGEIWHVLMEQEQLSLPKLTKELDAPRDLVMQAVGWLAREDKVVIEETPRGRVISLR